MRLLAAITGILLGSLVSVTASLATVILITLILGDEYPRLAHEFDTLAASTLVFLALTAIAAMSFYAPVKERRELWRQQGAMWGGDRCGATVLVAVTFK